MTYIPPRLPACLADTHSLKPIIGVPTDDEVKAIHAAIQGLNSILSVPALYDPNLPMQLAQHLFEAQMAVYRSKYSCGILLGDAVYTPPPLPSHIPIPLEPVVGVPSDEDLKLAQSAVRASEILANGPSTFDSDLSMKLSQHLFNIQIARYIQQAAQGQFDSHIEQTGLAKSEYQTISVTSQADLAPGPRRTIRDEVRFDGREERLTDVTDTAIKPSQLSVPERKVPEQPSGPQPISDETKIAVALEESNRKLSEIRDALNKMNRVLISTQRTIIGTQSNWNCFALVNQEGELPQKLGLPRLFDVLVDGEWEVCILGGGDVTPQQVAAYFKFYNIGDDLIKDDAEPTIFPGKEQEARRFLHKYLYTNLGSI